MLQQGPLPCPTPLTPPPPLQRTPPSKEAALLSAELELLQRQNQELLNKLQAAEAKLGQHNRWGAGRNRPWRRRRCAQRCGAAFARRGGRATACGAQLLPLAGRQQPGPLWQACGPLQRRGSVGLEKRSRGSELGRRAIEPSGAAGGLLGADRRRACLCAAAGP
jgi:hypothetical protein